jgi:hypothetical protein
MGTIKDKVKRCICHHCPNVLYCKAKLPEFNFDGLTGKEFKLMDILTRNRGIIVTYTELMRVGWGISKTPTLHNVNNVIWRLNKKVGIIKCKPGIGYWIDAPIKDDDSSGLSRV